MINAFIYDMTYVALVHVLDCDTPHTMWELLDVTT
jgi:hypothetical protein